MLTLLELTYWQSVWQNAIGCTIGNFVAIVASLAIYLVSVRQSEHSTKRANDLKESNQLKAFGLMLKDAIDVSTKQLEYITRFVNHLKDQPTIFPKPTIVSLGKLVRLNNTITVEGTGLAYMKNIPSVDSAKEFTQILDVIDYLLSEFSGIPDFVKVASLNHFDRIREVSNTIDDINKFILLYHSDPRYAIILRSVFEVKTEFLSKRKDPQDLKASYTLFLLPIKSRLEGLGIDILENDVFLRQLYYDITKGIEFYESLSVGYKQFEDEISQVNDRLAFNIAKIKTLSVSLLSSKFVTKVNGA